MKKLKLSLIALTAAVALFATSAQAASYGMDGRYDPFAPQIGSNQPKQQVVNYTTSGMYLSTYNTNFALYNFKGEAGAYGGGVYRYWQPKSETVRTLPDYSQEGANKVYNFDEYGRALQTSTDFSQYNYLGDDHVQTGTVYRFWSKK